MKWVKVMVTKAFADQVRAEFLARHPGQGHDVPFQVIKAARREAAVAIMRRDRRAPRANPRLRRLRQLPDGVATYWAAA